MDKKAAARKELSKELLFLCVWTDKFFVVVCGGGGVCLLAGGRRVANGGVVVGDF